MNRKYAAIKSGKPNCTTSVIWSVTTSDVIKKNSILRQHFATASSGRKIKCWSRHSHLKLQVFWKQTKKPSQLFTIHHLYPILHSNSILNTWNLSFGWGMWNYLFKVFLKWFFCLCEGSETEITLKVKISIRMEE